jgi:polyhydroxyalkanoate synthesis regulator protein
MMERAMTLFSPFRPEPAEPNDATRVAALQAEVESLRRQVAQLEAAGKRKDAV